MKFAFFNTRVKVLLKLQKKMDKNKLETASVTTFSLLQSSILIKCSTLILITWFVPPSPSLEEVRGGEGGKGILTIFGGELGVHGFFDSSLTGRLKDVFNSVLFY